MTLQARFSRPDDGTSIIGAFGNRCAVHSCGELDLLCGHCGFTVGRAVAGLSQIRGCTLQCGACGWYNRARPSRAVRA